MKAIFKTGTFLTAKNLNLAQRTSGLEGVIEGCDVIEAEEENLLCINKGLVKLPDGIILEFDGTEIIDISGIQSNILYYVCAIEYSNYSIDYDIVNTIPEYNHSILATVTKEGNSIIIENSSKSSVSYKEQHFELPYLKEYFSEGSIVYDDYGLKNIELTATITEGAVVSKDFYISFIANSSVNKLRLKGLITSPSSLYVSLFTNNYSEAKVSSYVNYLNIEDGYTIAIPYGMVNKNDKCKLKITLYNSQGSSAAFNLYEIILN